MKAIIRKHYTFVGSDYSQQEPRLLASYSNDAAMIQAYKDKKDLYAMIASAIYHNNYEDNLEFFPDGSMNPDGKKRRTNVKSLMLGIMYGMGASSLAESIKGTTKEAQDIIDTFYKQFPNVKKWIDKTESDAKKNGYVEDLWGRRRRLPDIQKEPYQIDSMVSEFNPIIGGNGQSLGISEDIKAKYINDLTNAKGYKQRNAIITEAKSNGLNIIDNSGFISHARRQCVNARVQGGAASMSKRAMIAVHTNPRLKELGFRLLIGVHDELIGECPIEYADEVKSLVSSLMINASKPECVTPMKCDADAYMAWYEDVYTSDLKKEYNALIKNGKSEYDAFEEVYRTRTECTRERLKELLSA